MNRWGNDRRMSVSSRRIKVGSPSAAQVKSHAAKRKLQALTDSGDPIGRTWNLEKPPPAGPQLPCSRTGVERHFQHPSLIFTGDIYAVRIEN